LSIGDRPHKDSTLRQMSAPRHGAPTPQLLQDRKAKATFRYFQSFVSCGWLPTRWILSLGSKSLAILWVNWRPSRTRGLRAPRRWLRSAGNKPFASPGTGHRLDEAEKEQRCRPRIECGPFI